MEEPWVYITKWKKLIYCMIPTTWQSGKVKTVETVKRYVLPGLGYGDRMNRQEKSAEDFQNSENTLYDTTVMDTFSSKWTIPFYGLELFKN